MYGIRWVCAWCLCLLVFALGVLPAEEPEPWYLISERELQRIEQYKATSEQEKQSWLSQVSALRTRAEQLAADSRNLNRQLAQAREHQRTSETLFEQLEADRLTLLSLKNGEIAELQQAVADKTLEAATYKGTAGMRLVIIIALAILIGGYIAFKVLRMLRIVPG